MPFRPLTTVFLAGLLIFPVSPAAAQTDRARVMGMVTDGSGGALPGVTVTLSTGPTSPAAVVTDGEGRYLTAWLPPGTYTVTFVLSGFETRTVNNVQLGAAQTVVLDQQLPLAPLTETVEVTAPAPPPPPPPPPPHRWSVSCGRDHRPNRLIEKSSPRSAARGRRWTTASRSAASSRIETIPVDCCWRQAISCGSMQARSRVWPLVRTWSSGAGSRPVTSSHSKKLQTFGEQAAGLMQITETHGDASEALVVYVCGEI